MLNGSALLHYSGQGYTPLLLATSLNLAEIAQLLLVTGADPNVQDWDNDRAAIHFAAAGGFGNVS